MSFALMLLMGCFSCDAQSDKKAVVKEVAAADKVEVYYFHYSRRCNTCVSVQDNAKLAVETLYADKVKAGKYEFKDFNLEEADGKTIGKQLGIDGQTLVVVYGSKKVDITDKGFMYANDPEKMKEIIKNAVDEATKG